MNSQTHQRRLARCGQLMKAAGLDVLILTKPANMAYLTGDGRLCAWKIHWSSARMGRRCSQTIRARWQTDLHRPDRSRRLVRPNAR